MKYQVQIERKAEKSLASLPTQVQQRIRVKIDALESEPRPRGCKQLSGEDAYRIRVGDYRIVYEIHDQVLVVMVIRIDHRREVYR